MNPLCFSCVVSDDESLSTLVPALGRSGFKGIEPTFTLKGGFPNSESLHSSADALRKSADAAGLKIPSMRGGPAFWDRFASPQKDKRDEAVKYAALAIEALGILGGSVLLAVPGRWTQEQDHDSMWKHAVETARQIGDLAGAAGITVALENVENGFLCSPREWDAFLTEMNHPAIGLYLDIGNVVRNRQGPPARWVEALGAKWARRIHFKGASEGGPLTSLLEGDVPWPAVMSALRAIDYSDWIGVEINPPPHCLEQWLRTVNASAREILSLPD